VKRLISRTPSHPHSNVLTESPTPHSSINWLKSDLIFRGRIWYSDPCEPCHPGSRHECRKCGTPDARKVPYHMRVGHNCRWMPLLKVASSTSNPEVSGNMTAPRNLGLITIVAALVFLLPKVSSSISPSTSANQPISESSGNVSLTPIANTACQILSAKYPNQLFWPNTTLYLNESLRMHRTFKL